MEASVQYNLTKQGYIERKKHDMEGEKIVGQYLDDNFYSTWTLSMDRNEEATTQWAGLDLTVTGYSKAVYTIDEKASTYWVNRYLSTFALEVNFINKAGQVQAGWLMDKNTINDYWLFVWLDSATTTELKSSMDITQSTVSLVKKSDMYNYFHKIGLTGTELIQAAKDLRSEFNRNGKTYTYIHGLKLTIQDKKYEHAINILFPRNVLVNDNDLATLSMEIKNGKQRIIRNKCENNVQA